VIPGDTDPFNGNQADVSVIGVLTDVQNTVGGADYNPQAAGPDISLTSRWRLSDTLNTTTGSPCSSPPSCPATLIDVEFPIPVQCTPTADPSVGSACSLNTTLGTVAPDVVKENRSSVLQLHRFRVTDAGPNGTTGDADDKRPAAQGIYIP
jgi:hypothetical protein